MKDDVTIDDFDLDDVYLIKKEKQYHTTYPNKAYKDERIQFTPKYNYRYDRFFIKNSKSLYFRTIPNNESDHLSITTCIEI